MLERGRTLQAEFAAATCVGKCRTENEDAWAVLPDAEVFAVADGCGGLASGRRAADETLRQLRQVFAAPHPVGPLAEPLANALRLADQEIQRLGEIDRRLVGMGCTVVALHLGAGWDAVTHVGDCRLYRYRGPPAVAADKAQLHRVTADHGLLEEVIRQGVPLREALTICEDHSNVITRAIGVGGPLAVNVQYLPAQPGDLYLLCSDGVSRALSDTEIRAIISDEAEPLLRRCQRLVAQTDDKGGHDNATAILVRR